MGHKMARRMRMDADVGGQGRGMSDAPIDHPTDAMVHSDPLGDEGIVLENEPVGKTPARGGGEFPDPDTPPSGLAAGKGHREHGKGQFAQADREEQERERDL
jgi:hypothetical protein